jgi:Domain of unknown function (DUF4335)
MPVLTRPISRIYTPPTCTLEVTAQPSALSRWTGTPVIKSLQFLLSFEGLSQGDREPIEVRGDQTQLANLSTVVTDYIQTLLASRATDLSIRPGNNIPNPIPENIPEHIPESIADRLNEAAVIPESSPSVPSDASVQIRPRSLLTHELTLGSLANESSGSSLVLKVSQLYDLATALDDSAADLQHLPALAVASPSWRTALPLARSAAVVLLTVGLGTAAWRLFQPGLVAVNQPERPSDSITALAPPASPSAKALPSLRPRPSIPLTLPSIQLPSRSGSSSEASESDDAGLASKASGQTDGSSSQQQSSTQSRAQSSAKNTAPQPSNPMQSGEVAIAPAPSASAPSTSVMKPAPDAQLDSSGAFAENRAMSKSSEAAPNAARQKIGQSSLFDTIGQVAEVRDYVASRWQPASPPPRTLEYRLTLNADGSLAQVDPLGALAQQYLGQLPLPAPQAPFVSAIGSGGRPTVRLVVRPDGTVQTFLDGSGRQ